MVDKRTLELVSTLRPEPGKSAAHVEFTRDGRYVLVSLWQMDGALIVYDAQKPGGREAHPNAQARGQVQRVQ